MNFSVYSQHASAVELLLFDRAEDPRPSRIIPLDREHNRTFCYWHGFVTGAGPGQLYGYRVHGPDDPAHGHRFDGSKLLLDPYARAVAYNRNYVRKAACRPGDNCAEAMKSVVLDQRGYDWEGDLPLGRPLSESVIYELHVGGFTRHPSSGVAPSMRGTYAGLIEKIPYLRTLGITAVELLPVQQFDPQQAPEGLVNYWGYSPVAFYAPHCGYSSARDPLGPVREIREMVKALHRAGIEVILDVVFTHTAEGGDGGPVLSFRGLENRAYYILSPDRARSVDYTGCGNTLRGNHSVVRRLILDCLRYWVQEMHVDGFRFDLASVLARDGSGLPLQDPPVLWEIETDPVLAATKIIAEPWDAAGLDQVDSFVGNRWAVWNGRFRDDVRRFVRGDENTVASLARRIAGSPEMIPRADFVGQRSVNLVTCHDGFTLQDLVTYNERHNEANRSGGTDGTEWNHSWNCGSEGPSGDPEINRLRRRQIKNFLTILLTAQGAPLMLMGDEVCRTQGGNNNAFCQDNELSWFDWRDVDRNADVLRFVRKLLRVRAEHSLFRLPPRPQTADSAGSERILRHGVLPLSPDYSSWSHSLAFSLHDTSGAAGVYVALNAYWEPLQFSLPAPGRGRHWDCVVDTADSEPRGDEEEDASPGAGPIRSDSSCSVAARSAVVLIAR